MIPPRVDLWFPRPLSYDDSDPFRGRIVIARLKDGVTLETAHAAMSAISARQGAAWICGGLLTGIGGARLLTGYVSGLLFRVTPTDVATFASVAAGLAAIGALATAIPALRASRIDPIQALRME